MYKYELINNHYIITIDGKKFLLDTGCPISFWLRTPIEKLTIDNHSFRLHSKPDVVNVNKVNNLVGIPVDGFVGLDIIMETSLTIYKNGRIDFASQDIDGVSIPLNTMGYLSFDVGCNLMSGRFIIDTGAKYAYGVKGLFHNKNSFAHISDYNPILGDLDGDLYHIDLVVAGNAKYIDICYNNNVASLARNMSAIIIGNITTLFEEVIVIDVRRKMLQIK